MEATPKQRGKHPWWQWALIGLAALVILGQLFGEDDSENVASKTTTVTVTQPAPGASEALPDSTMPATTTVPAQTLEDAQAAIDDDDYSEALAIAAVLAAAEANSIRRRISNRIARRVRSAIRTGDRRRAQRLLRQANNYPTTALMRDARADYRAAKARVAERARQRREAAAQRRRAAAERRRQEEAARAVPEPQGDCDSNYSGCVPAYPPDVDCPDVDGPVEVLGSDPHGLDRDGDGIGCDS